MYEKIKRLIFLLLTISGCSKSERKSLFTHSLPKSTYFIKDISLPNSLAIDSKGNA